MCKLLLSHPHWGHRLVPDSSLEAFHHRLIDQHADCPEGFSALFVHVVWALTVSNTVAATKIKCTEIGSSLAETSTSVATISNINSRL